MTKRSVEHDTIVLERRFEASPVRVFVAWADVDARRAWSVPNREWESAQEIYDFRVGGHEVSRFGPSGDLRFTAETNYLDIVPMRRIIMAGTMFERDEPISCSIATVELLPDGTGTRLVYTEQAAFLAGRESADARRKGWETNLDQLEVFLRRTETAS